MFQVPCQKKTGSVGRLYFFFATFVTVQNSSFPSSPPKKYRQCHQAVDPGDMYYGRSFINKKKKKKTFCGFPWVETSTAGRVYDLCVYYMTGAPEGSPKVVLWGFFYGEAGNRTCDPWFTRHSAYPLHHGGFSSFINSGKSRGPKISQINRQILHK